LDPTLTQLRQRMGTPHYMAPEQVENPQAVDHRADIFSLGVVFYEMLTGELPLGRFPAPSTKVRVDVRLDEVVLRALEKEPARRYQQAGEVKTEVERISGDPGGVLVRREGKAPRARWGAMKKAVAGLIWAGILFPFFLLALWMLGRGGGGTSENVSTILFLGLVVICGLAPVGTTGLGLFAIRDAYRERVGGLALGLSLGAAGLFPGLLVVLLVFGGWMLLIGLVFGGLGHILVPALALVASLATAGPLLVWFSTRIWRQANQRLTSPDAAAPGGRTRDIRWQPIVLVASQLLVCLILIGLLAAKTGHRRPTVLVNAAGDPVDSATGLPLVSSVSVWAMTTNGPAVNDSLAWSMPGGLRDDQKSVLERELADAWARYREMLAENSKILTNVHGHIEVELAMKPEELERLESSFWAEVDPHFDRAQQTFLRESIQFQPSSGLVPDRKTAPMMPGVPLVGGGSPLSAPSESEDSRLLLPMNGSLILEFWRVGSWYHWRSRSGSYNDGVPMDSLPITRGPEMPPEFRLLVEIAEANGAARP
ncbi:MAG: hypothetical protein JNK85_07435, partial [Verrucomicrobiales bacterium]|nr:hypothetical protein [Verrucomicrobiales bacterium]